MNINRNLKLYFKYLIYEIQIKLSSIIYSINILIFRKYEFVYLDKVLRAGSISNKKPCSSLIVLKRLVQMKNTISYSFNVNN